MKQILKYSKEDMMDIAGWMAAADNKRPIPELKEEAEEYIKRMDIAKRVTPEIEGDEGEGFFTGEKWVVPAVKGFGGIKELLIELTTRSLLPPKKETFNLAMYYRAKAAAQAIVTKKD